MKKQLLLILSAVLLLICNIQHSSANENLSTVSITNDGAWSWFSKPNAVYYEGTKKQTYFAWVNKAGDIIAASYNHDTSEYIETVVQAGYHNADYAAPSILIRGEGQIMLFYSQDINEKAMEIRASVNNEDITSWKKLGTSATGYSIGTTAPHIIGDDIYVLMRSKKGPTLSIMTGRNNPQDANYDNIANNNNTRYDLWQVDDGAGWQNPDIYAAKAKIPYIVTCQDSEGAIHMAISQGHPNATDDNIVHYLKLKRNTTDGKDYFYKADGSQLTELKTKAFAMAETPDIVYQQSTSATNRKSWVWDIALDGVNPVITYATFNNDGTEHFYNYARWNGTSWVNSEITSAGGWAPQTAMGETEENPYYSGGISLASNNPNVVYLSKKENGTFEMFKYTTQNHGATWTSETLSSNTPNDIVNIRPVSVRNSQSDKIEVLWMKGSYVNPSFFNTSIVYPGISSGLQSIEINETAPSVLKGDSKKLTVLFRPAFVEDKRIEWSSDNEGIARIDNDGVVYGVSEGTAVITAKSLSNPSITATCTINVTLANAYYKNVFFDFGSESAETAEGAIKVTPQTLISDNKAYGWISNDGLLDRFRQGPENDIERQGLILGPNPTTFKAYMENGRYSITVTQGDNDYKHDYMIVKANGTVKLSDITNEKGEFQVNTFEVNVTHNYLELEFSKVKQGDANWVVNSVKIKYEGEVSISEEMEDDILNSPETIIQIYDTYGRKLLEENLGYNTLHSLLTNSSLSKGIYIINMQKDNLTKRVKMIK